ncbi:MAG: protein-glutamate O-methyltransferase CheR [Phycisphaerales bacterium]|nr:protein-glutamate O-methyltransferase CheR [Phycisphaerales bacterium]
MDTLSKRQFAEIAAIARERWGLDLTDKKQALVQNRLAKMLARSQTYESIEHYLDHLRTSGTEEDMLVFFDILSTNTTSFFREKEHFDHLAEHFYPTLESAPRGKRVRIWSAACSNGSEPYTIGIHARECLPDLNNLDFKILATDLSNKALDAARNAVYPEKALDHLPRQIRATYFEPRVMTRGDKSESFYQVHPSVRSLVSVHQLNLMDPWPMKGPFDVIFLRNVMIYFDKQTREQLVQRMRGLLRAGGLLIIGSAETLSGLDVGLRMVRPAIYVK